MRLFSLASSPNALAFLRRIERQVLVKETTVDSPLSSKVAIFKEVWHKLLFGHVNILKRFGLNKKKIPEIVGKL
jgi:hypothetical protein